eukprot:3249584-Heterocapsa_arctica.AAC.1
MAEDLCHECKGTAKSVFIDGSCYKIGNSNYSGWGIWSPDDQSFNEHGPLKGKHQSSDGAEFSAFGGSVREDRMRTLHYHGQSICQRHCAISRDRRNSTQRKAF